MNAALGGLLWALVAGTAVGAFVTAAVGAAVRFARPAASTCCTLWFIPLVTCVVAPLAIVGAMTTGSIATTASTAHERAAGPYSPVGLVRSAIRTADAASALRPLAPAAKTLFAPPVISTHVALALVVVWLAGAIVGIIMLALSLARIRGLKNRSLPLGATLADDLPWLTDRPGREVYVRLSYEIETPIAIGFGRPVILIPYEMAATPDGLRAIETLIMHEYAHLVRYDDWTNCIARIVERVFWFNPLLWFLGRRIELEREAAADEAVVRRTHDAAAYASMLWRMAREMRMPQDSAVAPGAIRMRAELSIRIERLLQAPRRPAAVIGLAIVALAACSVCAAAGVAPPFAAHATSGSSVVAAKAVAQDSAAGAVSSPWPPRPTNRKTIAADRTHRRLEREYIDCNLQGADLHGQDLRGARFRNANMQGADLHDADLRDADLRNVNLQGADLDGADLRRARLLNTDLQGASTKGTLMADATLINTTLP